MRSLKVYNLFWSLTLNKCKKIQPKTRFFVYSRHPKNDNIDDVKMTFSPRE